MKKIYTLIMLLIVSLLMSGCGLLLLNDQQKFEQMMEIAGNNEYYFVYRYGISIDNKHYSFETFVENELNNLGIEMSSYSNTNIVLLDDKIFLTTKYTNQPENNKYILGYIDIDDLTYKTIELTDQPHQLSKIGDYATFLYNDRIVAYDNKLNKLELEIPSEGTVLTNTYNCGVVYYSEESNIVKIYDEDLNIYPIVLDENYLVKSISKFTEEYIILGIYDNNGYIKVGYDYKNNVKLTNEKIVEIMNTSVTNKTSYYSIHNNEFGYYEDEEFVTLIKEEDFKLNDPVVKQVEKIFNTSVQWFRTKEENGETYLLVGNDKSLFGAYSSGCTYVMIYKYDDITNTFEYLGCYGNIYSFNLISIRKKSN